MKSFLVFLFLFAFAVCQLNEVNREGRVKEMRKKMKDCLLKSELLSDDLKKSIENNKDDDLSKILAQSALKPNSNLRTIIKKCRLELFGKTKAKILGSINSKLGSKLNLVGANKL